MNYMHFNKVLNLEDFDNEELIETIREIMSHAVQNDPQYPKGSEAGKPWEMAMIVRGLRTFGAIRNDAEILCVGAGTEPTVFYLTNYVKRVFAVDLYCSSTVWSEVAPPTMLVNPGAAFPVENKWDRKRLIVQHMDGTDLLYPDNTFDGVFCNSSIEHFGSLEQIALASREMGRVLKPGGVLCLTTEYKISGPERDGIDGAIIFDRQMIENYIVKPSDLSCVDEIDYIISPATISLAYPLLEAINKGPRMPSVSLLHDGFVFTCIHLTLVKRG